MGFSISDLDLNQQCEQPATLELQGVDGQPLGISLQVIGAVITSYSIHYTKLYELGDISRPNYLRSLQWRGELPEDFDIDANEEELGAEEPALGMIDQTGQTA